MTEELLKDLERRESNREKLELLTQGICPHNPECSVINIDKHNWQCSDGTYYTANYNNVNTGWTKNK